MILIDLNNYNLIGLKSFPLIYNEKNANMIHIIINYTTTQKINDYTLKGN